MPINPEARDDIRRTIEEAGEDLHGDLRMYEAKRSDKIRDTHIAYARGASNQIVNGLPIEKAVEIMAYEIPYHDGDRLMIIDFLNHFLSNTDLAIRLDRNLNVYDGDVMTIPSGDSGALLAEFQAKSDEDMHTLHQDFAKKLAARLIGGHTMEMLRPLVSADIIWDTMDTSIVAKYLNEYLAVGGSTLVFDRYLDLVDDSGADIT